ncbi:MAG TPA: hypothetical protein VGK71_01230, partial [Nitrospirota bacterium]
LAAVILLFAATIPAAGISAEDSWRDRPAYQLKHGDANTARMPSEQKAQACGPLEGNRNACRAGQPVAVKEAPKGYIVVRPYGYYYRFNSERYPFLRFDFFF